MRNSFEWLEGGGKGASFVLSSKATRMPNIQKIAIRIPGKTTSLTFLHNHMIYNDYYESVAERAWPEIYRK